MEFKTDAEVSTWNAYLREPTPANLQKHVDACAAGATERLHAPLTIAEAKQVLDVAMYGDPDLID